MKCLCIKQDLEVILHGLDMSKVDISLADFGCFCFSIFKFGLDSDTTVVVFVVIISSVTTSYNLTVVIIEFCLASWIGLPTEQLRSSPSSSFSLWPMQVFFFKALKMKIKRQIKKIKNIQKSKAKQKAKRSLQSHHHPS
ncbi:hypothetical protein PGTUg99_026771 [Puccinia graminis f. sp. tritici]|uniref:Uncharacterized protein n=1 Tax=Puccinia graminis f. sp. tritici TaxID=56615 RepID=A0A5B0Q1E9_PUCGR|nr:hypothetical protein PGTUg99_026771 [Puccinia graminis f. sp. tritici]